MSECEIENTILKHYDIVKRLGKGAYGIVWRAKNKKNGNTVALKKIFDAFRNQTDAQRTFREITFLQAFAGHPNIIRLLNVIKADNNKDIYLVFEHMDSDLHNCIKKGNILKDVHKKYIFYQLLRAVKYIHSADVIHRDLKPSNVLLDSDCLVKVCDFGLTRSLAAIHGGFRGSVESFSDAAVNGGDPELTEYVATRWYRAPEILLASSRYTKFVDMWSLGCILGEMLSGKPIFPGSSTINQIERIVSVVDKPTDEDIASLHSEYGRSILAKAFQKPRSHIEALFRTDVDRNAIDLVKKLLVLNPSKRLTVEEALNHAYVKKFRDPSSEMVMDHVVTPPLSDDLQLSVAEYQQKLYEIILEKKAQRRIQRMLRTVKLDEENGLNELSSTENETLSRSRTTYDDRSTEGRFPDKSENRSRSPIREQLINRRGIINETNENGSMITDDFQTTWHPATIQTQNHRVPHASDVSPKISKHTSNTDNKMYRAENHHDSTMLKQLLPESKLNGNLTDKTAYSAKSRNFNRNPLRSPVKPQSYSRELDNPVILRSQFRVGSTGNRRNRHQISAFPESKVPQRVSSMHRVGDVSHKFIGSLVPGSYAQTYGTVSRSQLAQIQSRQWTR
ncbi:Mitogen-activated protein kinase [Fasciola hepatica]|uniref:Mitogen-activated protein kinase n=1 Tax=Fasciola hepatica TaxID=6192 RepID=A0A4E0R941_FASHE|nr:Mitogen-activated protein kinase [Fasciola hepatica]